MIKVERIQIKNYKNISLADISLGNINVIVGENGSGKSNLLSIIPLLNYIITGSINEVKQAFDRGGYFIELGYIWHNTTRNDLREPLSITIDFSNTDSDTFYSYQLELESVQIHEKLRAGVHFQYSGPKELPPPEMTQVSLKTQISFESLTYKLKSATGKPISIFKRKKNEISYGAGIRKTDTIRDIDGYTSTIRLLSLIKQSKSISKKQKEALSALEQLLYSNIYYLSPLSFNGITSNKLRIIGFDLEEELYYLEQSPTYNVFKPDFKAAIKNILGITDLTTIPSQDINGKQSFHAIVSQNGAQKNIKELSDGSYVLLALIITIFIDPSAIFLIEEPENSIHPRALLELMNLIRQHSEDKQFIITTHSPYLLNMIKPEEVIVAETMENNFSRFSKLSNVKDIKRKLAKSFMNFGDIIFAESNREEDGE